MTTAVREVPAFGEQLRWWRTHRRLSQLELGSQAEVSTRHLSFLETGRARPSREMVVHLCEVLDVPLRDRNQLLVGAGLAPVYGEHPLADDEMADVRAAMSSVLTAHEPNPAVVVDRHWNLVDANAPAGLFMADVADHLLEPPVNVVRVSLHPEGLAPTILNLEEYAAHMVWRLRRQFDRTGDPGIAGLLSEIDGWVPGPEIRRSPVATTVVLPLRMRRDDVVLEFFSTISVFGAPLDVTVEELAIEAFYPADDVTAAHLRSLG